MLEKQIDTLIQVSTYIHLTAADMEGIEKGRGHTQALKTSMQIFGFCQPKVNTPDLMECGVNRMDKRVIADFTSDSFLKGYSQPSLLSLPQALENK